MLQQYDPHLFSIENKSLVDTVLNILNNNTRGTDRADIGLSLVTLALLGLVSAMGFAHNYVILKGNAAQKTDGKDALSELIGQFGQSGKKIDPSLLLNLLRDGKGDMSLAPLLGLLEKAAKKEEVKKEEVKKEENEPPVDNAD